MVTHDLEYQHADDAIYWEYPIPGLELVLRVYAREIRKHPSGIHAIVSIELKRLKLAWGLLNVERDEDRVRLSNAAFGKVDPYLKEGKHLTTALLKGLLDNFCFGLWAARLTAFAPVMMAGSSESHPARFILPPYIVEGGGTILFAHPKKGKSFAALLMALCIDAGITTFWPVQQRKVMWINLERSELMTRDRLGNMNAILGLPRERPLLTLNARGRSLSEVYHAAKQAQREHGTEVAFLDSISRAGMGDLNENNPVNKIIDAMNGLTPTWLGIGHAPRGSDEHVYGGIHFDAGADVLVRLASEQANEHVRGIGLQVMDANETGDRRLETLALEFDALGLVQVRRAKRGEFQEVESSKAESRAVKLLAWVLKHGPCSAGDVQENTGMDRAWVSSMFASELHYVCTGKHGRNKLYAARENQRQ